MWWFARHQRALAESALVATQNEKLGIAKAFVDSKPQGVTPRELYRHAERTFGSQREALKCLLQLFDEGGIDRVQGARAQRFVRLPVAGQQRAVQ